MGCSTSKNSDAYKADGTSRKRGNEEDAEPVTAAEQAAEDAKLKKMQGGARRQGVAAESVDQGKLKDYKKPVHPKDQKAVDHITKVLKENDKMKVLFGHLDHERLMDVVNAFYLKDFADGDNIIKQGDAGDCLYIVGAGSLDVFVKRPGVESADPRGPKVVQLGAGSLFGELALMYNAPRAATVVAAGVVNTYKLDAIDFKMLLAQSGAAQAAQYEGWLKQVDILKMLNHYELAKLADILESECFETGEAVVKQGDFGEKFYILEDGTAAAYMAGEGGEKEVKKYEKVGEFFGELALITEQPRKATIRATGKGCNVVSVSKTDFTAVLGPITDMLRKHSDQYPQYKDFFK